MMKIGMTALLLALVSAPCIAVADDAPSVAPPQQQQQMPPDAARTARSIKCVLQLDAWRATMHGSVVTLDPPHVARFMAAFNAVPPVSTMVADRVDIGMADGARVGMVLFISDRQGCVLDAILADKLQELFVATFAAPAPGAAPAPKVTPAPTPESHALPDGEDETPADKNARGGI